MNKTLKRIICVALVAILLFTNDITVRADTYGGLGKSGSTSVGSAANGIRGESCGFRIGLKKLFYKTNFTDAELKKMRERGLEGMDSVIASYVKEHVPGLHTKDSMYVQVSGNDYTKDNAAHGDGYSMMKPPVFKYKSKTNTVRKDASAMNAAVQAWDPYTKIKEGKLQADKITSGTVNSALNATGKRPSKEKCQQDIAELLATNTQLYTSFQYWDGDKETDAKKAFNQHVAAMLTIAAAIGEMGNNTYSMDCVVTYLRVSADNSLLGDITETKAFYPIINIECINCYYTMDNKSVWMTPVQFFQYIMGVDAEEFTNYADRVGKKEKCNGDFLEMVSNVHRYKNSGKHSCCDEKYESFINRCMRRMYSVKLQHNSNHSLSYPSSASGAGAAHQAMTINAGNKMHGYCVAFGPIIATVVKPEGSFTWKLSETGNINAKEKGYCGDDLLMDKHPLYIKDISLKLSDSVYKKWVAYLNRDEFKGKKLYIKFDVYRKENTTGYKQAANSKVNGFITSIKNEGKKAPAVTSMIKKSDMKFNGVGVSGVSSTKIEIPPKNLLNLLRGTNSKAPEIKIDYITASLKDKKACFAYTVDCSIFVGSEEIKLKNNSSYQFVNYSAKTETPDPEAPEEPDEPVTYTYESAVADPYAELKAGTVTDAGANEQFEAMAGFPTTENVYFASGGSEYVVQLKYEYRKEQESSRGYTAASGEQRSSTNIEYNEKPGAQDSAEPGDKPKALEKTCGNCGHKVKTEYFPVRTEETAWNWKATAKVEPHVIGYTGGEYPSPIYCGGASATTTKSDSPTPGEPAVATCSCDVSTTVQQKKVAATRWNWKWCNYGHANGYSNSINENLPYTDNKSYPNTKITYKDYTLNKRHYNYNTSVSNASESCLMKNTNTNGYISHIISWDEIIKDYNYAKITDCKVWKLTRSKVDGTVDLVATDDIKATVQSQDTDYLYNVAEKDTMEDGRFYHSKGPQYKDDYYFGEWWYWSETIYPFNPDGYCEMCVEYEAGVELAKREPGKVINSPDCISDYLILRTTKGDVSLLYHEYNAENSTVGCGSVSLIGDKKGGSYKITPGVVSFKPVNQKATEQLVCRGNSTFVGIDLPSDGITFGGYNGNYSSPYTKYESSCKFTENIDVNTLAVTRELYPKYKATVRPSPVFKLVQNNVDVPDITVSNGLYEFGESSVFYKNIINYGEDDPLYDIESQEAYDGEQGFVLPTTYSPNHESINSVVVHNPTSSQYSMIVPLDKARDQRTTSSLIEDPFKNYFPGECTHDASTCPYSHLNCEYEGKEYHTEDCYTTTDVEYVISDGSPTDVDNGESKTYNYTGGVQKVSLAAGTYKVELWGAQGGTSYGGKGGYSTGTLTLTEPKDIYIVVGGQGTNSTGGYNGGGNNVSCGSAGGGATHIALTSGQLKDLASNKSSVIIVAGGGGGYAGRTERIGGAGGGTTGEDGYAGCGGKGYGGTQTEAGASGRNGTSGGFGYGGSQTAAGGNGGAGGGGGYYGGGAGGNDYSNYYDNDDSSGGGGSGYIDGVTNGSMQTGVNSGNGKVVITGLNVASIKKQTIAVKELSCNETHHSANSNWHYYIDGWEKEDETIVDSTYIGTQKIRPKGCTEWFTPSEIPDKLVLTQVNGEYKLAKKDAPETDLATGSTVTLDKYTKDGSTFIDCVWAVTNTDGPTIETKLCTAATYHRTFGDDTCWDPCDNDEYHKNTAPATIDGKTYDTSGEFLNIDYGFQIYFPNRGNFYGNGAYGIGEPSNIEGKGYTTPMDTTKWLRSKYVTFSFDVIYDKDGDGDFSDDKLYLGGEPIPLGTFTIHSDGKTATFTDDSPNDYIYNFYIPLEDDEMFSATVGFYTTANNSGIDEWQNNIDSHNYMRSYYAAEHDSMKTNRVDLVGRIGGLTMVDTGDFRFANLFKQITDGWLAENIVRKVDPNKQNYYMADTETVRGEKATTATNGLNTYGTQFYKNDLNKLIEFPLTPTKNNIEALQKQPQRVGYLNYLSLETIGNYYGENQGDSNEYKTQITPYYYHLDLTTGKWTPVDVYMLVGTQYVRINKFNSDEPIAEHEWFYSLNWMEESARRQYTSEEKKSTDAVVDKYANFKGINETTDTNIYERILVPSGKEYIFGTAQRLFLKDKNRTFIGTTLTQSVNTNPGERREEQKYMRNGVRWHFTLGLPSSAVFIPAGEPCTQANIDKYSNNHSVVICATETLARGLVWTLKYNGVPTQEQKIQILPNGKIYDYSGDPDGPGDKQIITVYSTDKSSKDDLNTKGTH